MGRHFCEKRHSACLNRRFSDEPLGRIFGLCRTPTNWNPQKKSEIRRLQPRRSHQKVKSKDFNSKTNENLPRGAARKTPLEQEGSKFLIPRKFFWEIFWIRGIREISEISGNSGNSGQFRKFRKIRNFGDLHRLWNSGKPEFPEFLASVEPLQTGIYKKNQKFGGFNFFFAPKSEKEGFQ